MNRVRFGSVCSGIEAASVAWEPLGWRAAWLSEIEPFPSAVLAHHYPNVPNLGDMTALPGRIRSGEIEAPDVFCGGTPCQAFSVAGLRRSLDDARGNLSLTFCEIADAIDAVRHERGEQPAIVFWENVPGVLSTADNAFGCFLAGLAGEDDPLVAPGGKWANAGYVFGPERAVAWRVLDAQYFGVAQRRRRVFVVASARDDFDPAAVLFEWDGLRRDSPPSREAGQATAGGAGAGIAGGSAYGIRTANTSSNGWGIQEEATHTLDRAMGVAVGAPVITMAHGQGGAEIGFDRGPTLTCNHEAPIAAYAIQAGALRTNPNSGPDGVGVQKGHAYTLEARAEVQAVAFSSKDYGGDATIELSPTLRAMNHADSHANGGGQMAVAQTITSNYGKQVDSSDTALGPNVVFPAMQVRRLTPVECERLQGFPDGYTMIPWRKKPASECPDGPRYKALGNSWAVPVVRWIGRRIDAALRALEVQREAA